ncbi:outer membrane protein assembly factor BamB family protein [Streptomyces sp. NPDC002285]
MVEKLSGLSPSDPHSVGSYRFVGRLGAGGMGTVYLAESPSGRQVAVKMIRKDILNQPGFRARFRREVELARTVSGAFTAPVVDADPLGDPAWLATLYIKGPSLGQLVTEQGQLSSTETLKLAAGLIEALMVIHSCGLIHRDLKPPNVLMAADGLRVIDFGISRGINDASITATGLILGTPDYMSPEQISGSPVGPASDIFALGSVLAFAVSGRPPFTGDHVPATLYKIVREDPDLSRIPSDLHELIRSCLSKESWARPSLEVLLEQVVEGLARRGMRTPTVPLQVSGEETQETTAGDFGASRDDTVTDLISLRHDLSPASTEAFPIPPQPATKRHIGHSPHASQSIAVKGHFRIRRWGILGLALIVLMACAVVWTLLAPGRWHIGHETSAVGNSPYGGTYKADGKRNSYYSQPVERPPGWKPWRQEMGVKPGGCSFSSRRLFCVLNDGTLAALSTSDGTRLWTITGGGAANRPPTVSGGRVYTALGNKGLRVSDAITGKMEWNFAPGVTLSVPAIVGGVAYTSGSSGKIYALESRSGRLLWARQVASSALGVAAVDGKRVYVTDQDGAVHAVAIRDGSRQWSRQLPLLPNGTRPVCGTPAVDENGLYCMAKGTIYALGEEKGRLRWSFYMSDSGRRSVAVAKGKVYAVDDNGNVVSLDSISGRKVWEAAVPGGTNIPPIVVQDAVYIGARSGHLVGFDAADGAWKYSLTPPLSQSSKSPAVINDPIVAKGAYYAALASGTIFSSVLK